jgi:hypothetical protein
MDTSKENILMCEKAVEIQEQWRPSSGDLYYEHIDRKPKEEWTEYDYEELLVHRILGSDDEQNLCSVNICNALKRDVIFLPDQDYLQGMLQPCSVSEIILRFYDWFRKWEMESSLREYTTATMERLWLGFVMKQKYNKKWSGTDWIKEE